MEEAGEWPASANAEACEAAAKAATTREKDETKLREAIRLAVRRVATEAPAGWRGAAKTVRQTMKRVLVPVDGSDGVLLLLCVGGSCFFAVVCAVHLPKTTTTKKNSQSVPAHG